MHLTDVQINLGIFTKTLVCVITLHTFLLPSSSNQFNSKPQISWSILSHPLSKSHHQFFTTFHVPFLCRFTAKLPIQVIK